MNPVVRGLAVYLFVLIIFRSTGKRSLKETTTFDFVLLLIISETTTDALIGEDYSLIACFVMVSTLVAADILMSLLKSKFKWFEKASDGVPLVIVDKGRPLKKRMEKTKVDEEDVLEAARLTHGLERMEQIKYAVLEKDGSISIIPEKK
ncbi:MAG TPA: YetF domain-containing protein [Flavisolibacter sp.]